MNRVGVNMSNVFLVASSPGGALSGVIPDLAKLILSRLQLEPPKFIAFPGPAELVASYKNWDLGFVADDPERRTSFKYVSKPYAELEATFLVGISSPYTHVAQVLHSKGQVYIASKLGAAYDLWLKRRFDESRIISASTLDGSFELFRANSHLDVLAGLRPKLVSDAAKYPGKFRILDSNFMLIRQCAVVSKSSNLDISGVIEELIKQGEIENILLQNNAAGSLKVIK